MESKINRFGILDFFKAFSSDTSIDSGRVNMEELKSTDWDVVSEAVKKELLVESPRRIQTIFKSLLTKINDTVLNIKASTKKVTRGKNIQEDRKEESKDFEDRGI